MTQMLKTKNTEQERTKKSTNCFKNQTLKYNKSEGNKQADRQIMYVIIEKQQKKTQRQPQAKIHTLKTNLKKYVQGTELKQVKIGKAAKVINLNGL